MTHGAPLAGESAPHANPSTDPVPDLAALGLDGLDPAELIRTSSYCAMVHAAQHLGHEITPALAERQLSTTLYLVLGLAFAEPGLVPAELARRSGMSPQHLATLLDGAEERGLVMREGQRGKGRATQVHVTRAGIQLLLDGWPVVHGAGAERLSATQHRSLQALLQQIRGDEHRTRPDDVVVLVDDAGHDAGTAPRLQVHTPDTPLHRAFSTYLVDDQGRLLLTRRALHKRTWPGVWTNTACGHLAPGETHEQAALRRVPQELGTAPIELRTVLPDFRYRAVDASGIVENELCPVMVGRIDAHAVRPDPDEVAELAWVGWDELRRTATETPFLLSPWCVQQVVELGEQPW